MGKEGAKIGKGGMGGLGRAGHFLTFSLNTRCLRVGSFKYILRLFPVYVIPTLQRTVESVDGDMDGDRANKAESQGD